MSVRELNGGFFRNEKNTIPGYGLLMTHFARMSKRGIVMKAILDNTCISAELMADLQESADKLARGLRDSEAAKQAAHRMDRRREENRRLFGVQNIGVDIIRQ